MKRIHVGKFEEIATPEATRNFINAIVAATDFTTDQAFTQMINTRGISKKIGLKPNTVTYMRHAIKNGTVQYSLDYKIKLLQLAGYQAVQQMIWNNPVPVVNPYPNLRSDKPRKPRLPKSQSLLP